ncbi:hypothetical protein GCM10010844_00720 [Deinococcus radiotolerans]|uniref:Uncharacterized protein n=1 Tax=Deinococcus radiotolerans TaxID=1309407 RepID=A0ABQ2FG48_9DEIO|nr:hypothetical protein GCM10010844_00720 [Deinococcus radiotolerans]
MVVVPAACVTVCGYVTAVAVWAALLRAARRAAGISRFSMGGLRAPGLMGARRGGGSLTDSNPSYKVRITGGRVTPRP